ncbi:ferric-dicitrate binding protein FerR, regulates iron transport through sigma-19 [Arachidicoccus rhizosphaerae]|uniref:Ferric-dicitrate binding protein FerR, regulates iron transport through sigma-19 n=1 Tax=Arachidicoccus rhizosphaerae TaxID=551991 RepID=A0A1H4BN47_9BACT|nr:FecR family protein [Arachidicoccus rhizosphaerae]SEA49583.1 ferric-dicitrate binding protein FerR, regulates iron transport through sigma-19 [Arachidicoccus rhizosphaerae]
MVKELIEKYFNGACSEKEKQELKTFFQEHPEQMDQFFDQSEWDHFETDISFNEAGADNFLEKLGTKLPKEPLELPPAENKIKYGGRSILRGVKLNRVAVAAGVCLLIGLSGYFLLPYLKGPAVELTHRPTPISSLYTIQDNKSSIVKTYFLPDLSEVQLSPGSRIKYLKDLNGTRRDIYLTGEGIFKVHKDAARPFTVYCREVATTALGTVFKVKEQMNSKKIAVTLLEGKILVRSTDKKAADGKDYYLLPGNQIAYSRVEGQFTEIDHPTIAGSAAAASNNHLNTDVVAVATESIHRAGTSTKLAITQSNTAIVFNDVRLARVLDLLAEKRSVKIAYPTNKVDNIKFIGTVNDHTPIEKVLSDIAAMNDLKLSADTLNHKYILQ